MSRKIRVKLIMRLAESDMSQNAIARLHHMGAFFILIFTYFMVMDYSLFYLFIYNCSPIQEN